MDITPISSTTSKPSSASSLELVPLKKNLSEPLKSLIFVTCVAVIVTQYFYFTMPIAYFSNELLENREISTTVTGLLYGAFSASLAMAALCSSKISRIMSPRTSLILSLVVLTFSTPPFIFLSNVPELFFVVMLFVARIAQGFVIGCSEPQLMSQMTALYPDRLGLIASCFEMGGALSSMAGPVMGGFFYQKYGFNVAFNFPSVMNLITSLIGVVALTIILQQPQLTSESRANNSTPGISSYKKMFILPIIVLGVNIESLISMLVNTVEAFFPNYLLLDYDKSEIYSGLAITIAGIIYASVTALSGWSGDRFNNRKLLILSGLLISGLSCVFVDVTVFGLRKQSYFLPSAMLCVLNIGSGMIQVSVLPLIILHYQKSTQFTIEVATCDMSGLFRAMYFIGAFFGPVLGGYILQLSSYPVLFLTLGLLLVFHFVYVWVVNLCRPDLFSPDVLKMNKLGVMEEASETSLLTSVEGQEKLRRYS